MFRRANSVLYFAYGSNLSLKRLSARIRIESVLGPAFLPGHSLRFHKVGRDGSGKCNAWDGDADGSLFGMVYEIDRRARLALDRIEGRGFGYSLKPVEVSLADGSLREAVTYCATRIDDQLLPFDWYHHHVLTGAREAGAPESHLRLIESTDFVVDTDSHRARREMAIYTETG